jgi:hypothetical protein
MDEEMLSYWHAGPAWKRRWRNSRRNRAISRISIWNYKFATIVKPDDIDRFVVLLRGREIERWSAFS